ncbi:hypothetical protein GWK47_019503 [Chionoecetes opilio]|uniref:Uncharacterized protein n=1 Tax=Chionoecetes opilio TaxID=41210 RepID=A0A8J4XUD4_CHIOP|nr:hypothetical protein GWK47_019503 [Chionoecetes opilio]
MATTSTSTVKAFHSVAVAQVKARWPHHGVGSSGPREGDHLTLPSSKKNARTDLLHWTRSPASAQHVSALCQSSSARWHWALLYLWERTILYDGPHLGLVQPNEAVSVEQMPYLAQESHPQ